MNPEAPTPAPPPWPAAPLPAPPVISPPPPPVQKDTDLVWGFWLTMAFGTAVAGAMIAVQSAVVVGFMVASAAVGQHPSIQSLESDGLLLSVATVCSTPVVVGLSALFAWLRRGLPVKDYLALKPMTLKGLGLSFVALLGMYGLWAVTVKIFDLPETSQFMLDAYRTAKVLPLLWFAVILAAPAAEESFFRGFLFQGLMRSRAGPRGAILITSVLWAAIHVQYGPVEIAFIFLLGLVLGTIRFKTASLWPPFLVHAVSNLIATVELALLNA